MCTAFEPEFERAAAAFAGAPSVGDAPLLFGRCAQSSAARRVRRLSPRPAPPARSVDVDAHGPVAKSFGVSSVPFVTLLRHGASFAWDDAAGEPVPLPATRFDGALSADAVVAWLSNRRGVLCFRRARLPAAV